LRERVGPACDSLRAEPSRAIVLQRVRARLAAEHQKGRAKKRRNTASSSHLRPRSGDHYSTGVHLAMNDVSKNPASEEAAPSPVEKLARLKTIVTHIADQWGTVLHRQTYFHAMTRSTELADALQSTYAAHVHNTVTDTFVIDLIREIGALVLDRDSKSASVAVAVRGLRDPLVLDELRKDYRIVLPSRWLSGRVPAEVRREFDDANNERQIIENLAEFDQRLADVTKIPDSILDTDIGDLLRIARNKSVAHYDVVRDGADWRMWHIEGTGLTYGKLDEYVDACTSAVDGLLRLVKRTAHDFEGTRQVAQDYANDYVGALVIGLQRKKELREARLASADHGMTQHTKRTGR